MTATHVVFCLFQQNHLDWTAHSFNKTKQICVKILCKHVWHNFDPWPFAKTFPLRCDFCFPGELFSVWSFCPLWPCMLSSTEDRQVAKDPCLWTETALDRIPAETSRSHKHTWAGAIQWHNEIKALQRRSWVKGQCTYKNWKKTKQWAKKMNKTKQTSSKLKNKQTNTASTIITMYKVVCVCCAVKEELSQRVWPHS